MFYREAGQFKTSYAADSAVFPIRQDRIALAALLAFAFVAVPLTFSNFWIGSVLIPVLVFALAAIGLNLLTGYAGQVSLGTGAFMGVGAYACYKLTTLLPNVNIIVLIVASGFVAAAVGTLFGLPSLRIKGFYLAVATLAAQFFLSWSFVRVRLALQLQCLGRHRGADPDAAGRPRHRPQCHAFDPLPDRAGNRRRHDMGRLQPRSRPDRPHVDGGARHGHRGRADRDKTVSDQAAWPSRYRRSIAASPAP